MDNIDPQVTAHKHRMQMDALIKEGEYKKNEQKRVQLDMEMRQAKRKIDLLRMEMEKNKLDLDKLTLSQLTLAKDIKKLKKEIAGM